MSTPLTPRASALRSAIEAFLHDRLETKLKSLPGDDPKRASLHAQYERESWLADAARRVSQIQMVTHVLKATHPGAQGSSLFAAPASLPDHGLVGTRCLGGRFDVDFDGTAAALDIVPFLRLELDGRSLLDGLVAQDADLHAALCDDPVQARARAAAFTAVLDADAVVASHTLAKQVYWPVGDDALDDLAYHLLAPLYASSLAHHIVQTVNADRFGDAAKAARQARWHQELSDSETRDYPELAVQKLGGTKPQNISKLNSERRGVNYLLASLPPQWTLSRTRPPLHVQTVLKGLGRRPAVRAVVRALRRFLETDPPPNQATRDRRDQLAGRVADEFLDLEMELSALPPGWSAHADCRLDAAERFWLDPRRAETDPEFAAQRAQSDWPAELARRLANWLNDELGEAMRGRLVFDEASYGHWFTLLLDELQARQREGLIDA